MNLHPTDFDCNNCSAEEQLEKGCKQPTTGPGFELNGERVTRCLVKLVHPVIWEWLNFYAHYKQGHLYYAGGVSSQPTKYLRVMARISSLIAEDQKENKDGG